MGSDAFSGGRLFADEITEPVLDPGLRQTRTGQLFAYANDELFWGDLDLTGIADLHAPHRKAENSIRDLAGLKGTPQVSGYAGCKVLAAHNAMSLAFLLNARAPPVL